LFCRERKIIYQGFSLLTANQEVLRHPLISKLTSARLTTARLTTASLAANANATPAQVVFSFARAVGILPLTGTSDPEHMKQDLASRDLTLPPDAIDTIESLAG
jgi:diketogulonate reductase-like aldo/keto reductase